MTETIPPEVVHNQAANRFEVTLPGVDAIAAAYYQMDDNGHRVLTHTEVPQEFGGQGIASKLARAAFDDARAQGLKLVLKCPFMASWYARHPDYGDVVAG